MCVLVRSVEASGSAAFITASFAILAHEFPDNVASVFVSTGFQQTSDLLLICMTRSSSQVDSHQTAHSWANARVLLGVRMRHGVALETKFCEMKFVREN